MTDRSPNVCARTSLSRMGSRDGRISEGVAGLFLPLLLSVLPVLLLWWQAAEEVSRQESLRQNRWIEQAKSLGQRLKEQAIPGFWPEEVARRIRSVVRVGHLKSPRREFAALLGEAVNAMDSPSSPHHLRGLAPARIWGVTFGPEEKPTLCRHPRLETSYGSLISGIFNGRAQFDDSSETPTRIPVAGDPAELSASRLKTLFGPSIVPEAFSDAQRGKAFAVIHRGQFGFLLWDLVFASRPAGEATGPRILGGYVLYQPLDTRNQQTLLRICLTNWHPMHGLRPVFIPLNPATAVRKTLYSPSLLKTSAKQGIREFARGFSIRTGRLPDRPRADLKLPFTKINRLLPLDPDNRFWAFPLVLPPLSGHLGLLVGSPPHLRPPMLAEFSWLVSLIWGAGWLTIGIRFCLFGGLPDLRVRNSLLAWMAGVIAMPLVLSLGTSARYQSDLSSNLLDRLRLQMSDSLQQVEAGSSAINERYQEELRRIAADPEMRAKMVAAKANPDLMPVLRQALVDRFQASRLPVNCIYLFGKGKFTVEYYSPTVTSDIRKVFADIFGGLWNRFEEILRTQENGSIAALPAPGKVPVEGADGNESKLGGIGALFPSIRITNSSRITDGLDTIQIGRRRVVIGKKVIPLENGFGFFLGIWANPEALHRQYLSTCLAPQPTESQPAFLAFSTVSDPPRPLAPIEGRHDARLYGMTARKALKQPVWTTDVRNGELILARTSAALPGFILQARGSLNTIYRRQQIERVRFILIICCLLWLIFSIAKQLETRLAKPVEQMARGLESIAEGNLDIRLGEQRADELGESARTVDRMTTWLQERRLTSRFVSPEVLDLVNTGDSRQTLAGSRRTAILLVSDIRSFTTLTETHSPEAIFQALDDHLTAMTEAIQEHGGVIDRFIGDAIQAVFYPTPACPLQETADAAVQASLAMIGRHRDLQNRRRAAGEFVWEIGIGLETGEIIAGVMGDPDSRLDFSVLGEPLRRAAELESMSRYGCSTRIVISRDIATLCGGRLKTAPIADHPEGREVLTIDTSASTIIKKSSGRNLPDHHLVHSQTPAAPRTTDIGRNRTMVFPVILLVVPLLLIAVSFQGWLYTRTEKAEATASEHLRRALRLPDSNPDLYLPETMDLRRRVSWVNRELHRQGAKPASERGKKILNKAFTPLRQAFPNVGWFAFDHVRLPPYRIEPVNDAQRRELNGGAYEAFPAEGITLVASGGTAEQQPISSQDALHLFDLIRTQIIDRVQELPSVNARRMITPSANWAFGKFPNLFGVAGMMSVARFLNTSCGKPLFTLIQGRRYLIFWDFFLHPEVMRKKLATRMKSILGGILVFIPIDDSSTSMKNALLVNNLRTMGFEAALLSPEDEGTRCWTTPAFRRNSSLRAALSVPPKTVTRIADHFVMSRIFTRDRTCTLIVATPADRTSLLFRRSHQAILAGLLLTCVVWLLRTPRFSTLSLRWQLAGAFLLVLSPALIHAIVSLDRSRSERFDRLLADGREILEERLRSFDESSRVSTGWANAFIDAQVSRPSFLNGMASLARDCTPPSGKSASRELAIPLGDTDLPPFLEVLNACFRHGLAVKQIGAIGPHRFAAGFDQKLTRLEIFHGVFSPIIKALVPAEDSGNPLPGGNQRALLVGSEIEKALNMFRSMLPPEGWAALMAEPRHLQVFANPRSFEFLFLLRHLFRNGQPLGPIILFWEARGCLIHHFMGWRTTPSREAFSHQDLHVSLPNTPSFQLAPPFLSWTWEAALRGEVVTTRRVNSPCEQVMWQAPVWTTLNILADALQEPIFTPLPSGRQNRLRAVLPGPVLNGMLLGGSLSWKELSEPLQETLREERLLLVALILLAIGLADRTAHRFLQPLLELVTAARRIMSQDFSVRLPVTGTDEFGRLAEGFNKMAAGVEEGRLLSRFVSESVRLAVSDKGGQGKTELERGSRSVETVILFVGLPGFAKRSATESAPELVQDLNLYLREMASLIRAHGGEIDKFIGEKVLAVFHPDRLGGIDAARTSALAAAAAMPSRLARLEPWRGYSLGIGIVTGTVLSGILGTAKVRLEYTVIGDPVNLAARLCEMACKSGAGTVMDAGTAAFCREHVLGTLTSLGFVALKGKARQVEVYQMH